MHDVEVYPLGEDVVLIAESEGVVRMDEEAEEELLDCPEVVETEFEDEETLLVGPGMKRPLHIAL